MKRAKLSEVKNHFSEYVSYVRRGGYVRILVRDVPVADLVPVAARGGARDGLDEEILADLERRGLVRRGGGEAPAALLRPGVRTKGRPLSELLIAERRSGR
jgi:prevent-host-death family protein